jgi:hypothetical protein
MRRIALTAAEPNAPLLSDRGLRTVDEQIGFAQ